LVLLAANWVPGAVALAVLFVWPFAAIALAVLTAIDEHQGRRQLSEAYRWLAQKPAWFQILWFLSSGLSS